ncbi:MAG: hypothetical protein ACKO38_18050, partial [Planctomycetota bacterium]
MPWLLLSLVTIGGGCSTKARSGGPDGTVASTEGPDSEGITAVIPARPPQPSPRDQGYVGSAACQPCHSQIYSRYQGHPMAHSFQRVHGEADAAAEFPEFAELPIEFRRGVARDYGVELREGRLWHRESQGMRPLPPENSSVEKNLSAKASPSENARPALPQSEYPRTAYSQSEPIAFAIGSGRRGRTYVLERDGWLTISPISWYATERRWDLSPEYDPESHPRFDRPVADRCLQCHAGRVEPAADKIPVSSSADAAQAFAVGPATGDVIRYSPRVAAEVGIGCERCHGPGERHVAAATRSQPLRDTICNPAHLTADRADDVCNQCHLSGAAQVLRYGRRHGDFRPGDRLSDVWLTLVDDEQSTRASTSSAALAVSHVWQTRASRCYQASGGELRCVSCHDPHGVPDAEARVAFFDNK